MFHPVFEGRARSTFDLVNQHDYDSILATATPDIDHRFSGSRAAILRDLRGRDRVTTFAPPGLLTSPTDASPPAELVSPARRDRVAKARESVKRA